MRSDQSLLDHVFGAVGADDGAGEPQQGRLVAANDLLERKAVALSSQPYETLVRLGSQ